VEDFGVLINQKIKIMNQFKSHAKNPNFIFCVLLTAFFLIGVHSSKAADFAPSHISLTDTNSPESVWNTMKSCLTTNNIRGAVSCFSVASQEDYQQAFSSMSKADLISYVKGLGPIKKASMEGDKAQYYFENVIGGKTITFPVEFDKENGVWKIMEF
jgi:hypothetical protein